MTKEFQRLRQFGNAAMTQVKIGKIPSSSSVADWLQIGTVGQASGLNGAFQLASRSGALDADLTGLAVFIGATATKGLKCPIKSQAVKPKKTILACTNILSRTAIELLRHQPVWLSNKDLIVDHRSEYLWSELIGLCVISSDSQVLGTISKIENFGASDIVELESATGQSLAIPLVATYFDMSFDQTSKHLSLIVAAATFDDCWA